MKNGFQQLIIGFVFVYFNIFLVVDILPNFLGYIFIFNGIKQLAISTSLPFQHLRSICILMVIASVPHFFPIESTTVVSWLSYYAYIMVILKLIFMYMLFQFLIEITSISNESYPQMATAKIKRWYLSILTLSAFIEPFLINMLVDVQVKMGLVILICNIIIEFCFLIYLFKMRNYYSKGGPKQKINRAMELVR